MITQTQKRSSSLDYWNNYLGNPNDPKTRVLLAEITELLDKVK
jgi:hypothetical protein